MRVLSDDVQRRFLTKFRVGDGCWEWEAGANSARYGYFHVDGREERAHRVSYELFVGAIPDGLSLDHLCGNTLCVRPDHLEPVTQRENVLRGKGLSAQNAAKTHCPRGHEYDEKNTCVSSGRRNCRKCNRDHMRQIRSARRATL